MIAPDWVGVKLVSPDEISIGMYLLLDDTIWIVTRKFTTGSFRVVGVDGDLRSVVLDVVLPDYPIFVMSQTELPEYGVEGAKARLESLGREALGV